MENAKGKKQRKHAGQRRRFSRERLYGFGRKKVHRNVKDRFFRFLFDKDREALYLAIEYCIGHDILSEFLRDYQAEVVGMLLEKFDIKKYERSLREEGREEGIEQGIERANRLMSLLLEQNRMDDLKRATKDPKYRKKLFREFGL